MLNNLDSKYGFKMESAESCDQVMKKMKQRKHHFFDIVLLDIGLPASKDGSIVGGEDLGLKIRKKFPKTKIIVHTALNDQERISNIFRSLNPEGFMIKSDIGPEELSDAINSVLDGHTYYSEHTNRLIDENSDNKIFLDSSDRKILYRLSKGERMKDLPKYIPFSLATIERRKKKLKLLFGIPDGGDKELLDIARTKGFI